MVSTARWQRRRMQTENAKQPAALREIPRGEWPEVLTDRRTWESGSQPERAWRSREFFVTLWLEPSGHRRLSTCRTEWDTAANRFSDGISWDDLQRLKREAGYGDCWALEVYPADRHTVNVANLRHIFLLPERPPFAWSKTNG